MDKSFLVKILGFPATLIHGDTLVFDRWLWLKKHLPKTANGESLIDIGCGTGAFTIGAALLGYKSLGLSWDERNMRVAKERSRLCNTPTADFEVIDIRQLNERKDFVEMFDIAICFENIEHILNDLKLIRDISKCLKPGGRLLLVTPNYYYRPITSEDLGPFSNVENGEHVRRGYSKGMLLELCQESGLILEGYSFCSGFLSQKFTAIERIIANISPLLAWSMILPLRFFIPLFDDVLTRVLNYPYFSVCIEAYKPKYTINAKDI